MTGKAKKDLKKTASPGGTDSEVTLISDAIATKRTTDINLNVIPRIEVIKIP